MNDNKMLLNMALGTFGTILILVGIIIMIVINNSSNPSGYLIYLIGFSLVMVYIDFLVGYLKKAKFSVR